jgi:hypothetical protein
MDTILLAIQAKILLWVGLAYIAAGVWLGTDPSTIAWRAAAAALVAMAAGGWLMRRVAQVIEERAATDIAERQLAAEKASEKAAERAAEKPPAEKAPARAAGARQAAAKAGR